MYLPYSHRHHVEPVPGAAALHIESLSSGYNGRGAPAIHDLHLTIPKGTRIALVGPNGAGKSTLLKVIAGLLPIQTGQVEIYGRPVGACHHRVSYLPQRGQVDWRFPISVRRLVVTGRYVHLGWLTRPRRSDWHMVDEVMARLGISHLAERQIGQLSGGQQQRALLARALVQEADLLLLDEPLNAVDAETRHIITNVLTELQQSNKTVLVATHDLDRLETDFDGAYYLHEGREISPPPGSFAALRVGRLRD